MFTYREVAPAPALARYVKCFWLLRAEWDAPRTERIIPDGSFEMVFHFGDPFAEQPRAMLMGEIRRPVLLCPSRHADVLGVRFHPGGAAPFEGTIQGKLELEEYCWTRAKAESRPSRPQ